MRLYFQVVFSLKNDPYIQPHRRRREGRAREHPNPIQPGNHRSPRLVRSSPAHAAPPIPAMGGRRPKNAPGILGAVANQSCYRHRLKHWPTQSLKLLLQSKIANIQQFVFICLKIRALHVVHGNTTNRTQGFPMPSTTHLPAAADSQNSTLMTPSVRAIQALVGGNTATARTVQACLVAEGLIQCWSQGYRFNALKNAALC